MKKVNFKDILPLEKYESERGLLRPQIFEIKNKRRIHVGPYLTFLFENYDTILYQIHEMLRAEKNSNPDAIRHEIETYNELIGERGEVGCTLLIEIEDKDERAKILSELKDLPQFLYIKTNKGEMIPAIFDPRQVGDTRVSSVQYLKFKVGDNIPVAIGSSHPKLKVETTLTPEQSAVLCKDLLS